jgi:hypothetical protein
MIEGVTEKKRFRIHGIAQIDPKGHPHENLHRRGTPRSP